MRSAAQVLAAAVVLAVAIVSPSHARAESPSAVSRTTQASGPVRVGQPFPTFAGWLLNGQMLGLKSLLRDAKGPIVISVFATWCEPCKQHLPELVRVVGASQAAGAKGVLIAYGENADVVRPFVDGLGISWDVVLDPFTKISERIGVTKALPRTFVIDSTGVVRTIFEFEGSDFEQAIRDAVQQASQPITQAAKAE